MMNLSESGSFVTFVFHFREGMYSCNLVTGSTPSKSMYLMPYPSSTSKSTSLLGCFSFFCFQVAECFLGNSRIGTDYFCLSFFGLWISLTSVGLSLDDLGAIGIGTGASTLTTSRADPSDANSPQRS